MPIKRGIDVILYPFRSIFKEGSLKCNETRKALCQSNCIHQTQPEQMCTPPDSGARMSRQPDSPDRVQTGTVIRWVIFYPLSLLLDVESKASCKDERPFSRMENGIPIFSRTTILCYVILAWRFVFRRGWDYLYLRSRVVWEICIVMSE